MLDAEALALLTTETVMPEEPKPGTPSAALPFSDLPYTFAKRHGVLIEKR